MKKEFTVKCKNCGKEFVVVEEENKFPIKGDKYFCCRSCACTRHHSKETKEKISKSLFENEKNKAKRGIKEKTKYICGDKDLDLLYEEISRHKITKWFNNLIPFGFDISSIHTERIIYEYNKVKKLLYNEYVINSLSPADIYKKYNCYKYINNSEVLLHIFKSFNFPIRGWSKAVSNAIKNGNLSIPKISSIGHEQWYTTWENKEVFLRSKLELEYAKYLDCNRIKYDVECLRIKYFDTQNKSERCAIPDFYLQDTNTIVEIKSDYTLDIQNMKDKFLAYKKLGYNTKLILDKKEVDLYLL